MGGKTTDRSMSSTSAKGKRVKQTGLQHWKRINLTHTITKGHLSP